MSGIYKYNKPISRFYDAVYDKILSKDGLIFYLNEINKTNGAILEIGAGTGRIFVPSLNSGADIYGIEPSENMLEILKGKIPESEFHRIFIQDVRDLSLNKKFSLIYAPFRIFSHLLTVKDQLKALNNIYYHLEPGGRFIFDVFVPDLNRITADTDNIPEFDGEYEPGKKLKRFASIKYNHIEQLMDLKFKFIFDEDGKENTEECSFPFRYYFRYEIEHLIERTELSLNKIFGSFSKEELTNESKDFIVVCSRPEINKI
jgi:SAM-dependent methyltransferase